MAELARGAKAGIVSGVIYGALNGLFVKLVAISVLFPSAFAEHFGQGLLITWFGGGVIFGVIGGVIFGLILAAGYTRLSGRTSVIKGVILSIPFWVVMGIYDDVMQTVDVAGWDAVMPVVAIPLVLGLAVSILWGVLLGFFWDRFGTKPPAVE